MPDAYNPWAAPVFPTAADNAMQPETFVPQGVQQWTQQAAPKDYNILSQIAGSLGKALMYPGQVAQSQTPISTEDMVGPAFNLAGMLTLGAGAAPQEANALNMGIKAYHGSPHDFDKFDLSKIGTGEGAQAYGHGLYFADSEGVAKSYRDALSGKADNGRVLSIDGQTVASPTPAMNFLNKYKWDVDSAVGAMQPRLTAAENKLKTASKEEVLPGLSDYDIAAADHKYMNDFVNELHSLRGKNAQWVDPGHMYEVNISADPSHFLDWDRKVRDMPEEMQQRLMDKGLAASHGGDLGSQIYHRRVDEFGPDAATQQLREAGIPGIKYLDQGSRAHWSNDAYVTKPDAQGLYSINGGGISDKFSSKEAAQAALDKVIGSAPPVSRNYVVFNHDLIDIMRKYAVPGMLGAPILANALSEQKT